MNNFLPIELWFSTWPTVRADIEALVPDRPVFIQSYSDRSLIELDQTWAIQMLALAPDEESFNILMARIKWLATVNAAALQACRLDQYLGEPLTAHTLAEINDSVQRQDAFRQSARLPTFKELALEALGLCPAVQTFEFVYTVQ